MDGRQDELLERLTKDLHAQSAVSVGQARVSLSVPTRLSSAPHRHDDGDAIAASGEGLERFEVDSDDCPTLDRVGTLVLDGTGII